MTRSVTHTLLLFHTNECELISCSDLKTGQIDFLPSLFSQCSSHQIGRVFIIHEVSVVLYIVFSLPLLFECRFAQM